MTAPCPICHNGPNSCACPVGPAPASPPAPTPEERPLDETRLRGCIAFMRGAWLNDGAEGESVHLLCNEAERLLAERARAATREPIPISWQDKPIAESVGTLGPLKVVVNEGAEGWRVAVYLTPRVVAPYGAPRDEAKAAAERVIGDIQRAATRERELQERAERAEAGVRVRDDGEYRTRCALGGIDLTRCPPPVGDPIPATTETHDAALALFRRERELAAEVERLRDALAEASGCTCKTQSVCPKHG